MAEPAPEPSGAGRLLVRFFAGAATAAGCEEMMVEVAVGSTVGDVLAGLTSASGGELARVVSASSFLLDAVSATAETVIPADALKDRTALLDVLPPFAGG